MIAREAKAPPVRSEFKRKVAIPCLQSFKRPRKASAKRWSSCMRPTSKKFILFPSFCLATRQRPRKPPRLRSRPCGAALRLTASRPKANLRIWRSAKRWITAKERSSEKIRKHSAPHTTAIFGLPAIKRHRGTKAAALPAFSTGCPSCSGSSLCCTPPANICLSR